MKSQDSQLIYKAKSGDENALQELLSKYKIAVYNLIYRMVKDKQEAEDLTQETFIKTFKSLPSFNEDYAFSTWIFKIATNNCIDFFRKRKLKTYSIDKPIKYKTSEIQQDHPDPDLNAEKNLLAKERSELIKEAIGSLPKKYNEAIVLRHRQEKSYEEISEMLYLPLGTVKARIFRAREMLNKALKDKLSGY